MMKSAVLDVCNVLRAPRTAFYNWQLCNKEFTYTQIFHVLWKDCSIMIWQVEISYVFSLSIIWDHHHLMKDKAIIAQQRARETATCENQKKLISNSHGARTSASSGESGRVDPSHHATQSPSAFASKLAGWRQASSKTKNTETWAKS